MRLASSNNLKCSPTYISYALCLHGRALYPHICRKGQPVNEMLFGGVSLGKSGAQSLVSRTAVVRVWQTNTRRRCLLHAVCRRTTVQCTDMT